MPRSSTCPEPGCPNLTPCPRHPEPEHRSPSSRRTGRRDWRAKRLRILRRDRHVCHWCGAHASQVDHKIPVSRGGTDADGNLVASCAPCNNRRNAGPVKS